MHGAKLVEQIQRTPCILQSFDRVQDLWNVIIINEGRKVILSLINNHKTDYDDEGFEIFVIIHHE